MMFMQQGPELPAAGPPCEPTESMDLEDVLDGHSREEVLAHAVQVDLRKEEAAGAQARP